MFCGKCGEKVPKDSSFCPKCGEKTNAVTAPIKETIPVGKKKCKECKKLVDKKEKKCPNCGAPLNKTKKTIIIISIIVGAILALIIGIILFGVIREKNKENKYYNAIELYNNQEYDKAKEIFNDLEYYEYSHLYIKVIDAAQLLEKDKYAEALQILETIPDDIIDIYSIKNYSIIGTEFNKGNYNDIYEDYKYKTTFYNDKEKEMVYESFYQYGLNEYNNGKYTTAKEAFDKIKDYKNVSSILSDKYFGLIGNYYSYSISYGYKWGLLSLSFYSYGNKVIYNVFTQSLFDTNIPTGYDYEYKIIDDVLYIGDFQTYRIASFDGYNLVLKDGGSTFNLVKS